jgi:hypothetical protein
MIAGFGSRGLLSAWLSAKNLVCFRLVPARVTIAVLTLTLMPQASVANGPAEGGVDDVGLQELYRQREQMKAKMDAINASNPMSGDYGHEVDLSQIKNPQDREKVEKARRVLEATPIPRMMAKVADSTLQSGFQRLMQHPNRNLLIYLELGALVVLYIMSAWRQAIPRKWYWRLFIRAQNIAISVFVTSVVLPYLAFGTLYFETLAGLIRGPQGQLVQEQSVPPVSSPPRSPSGDRLLEDGEYETQRRALPREPRRQGNESAPQRLYSNPQRKKDLPAWKKRLNQTQ